MVYVQCESPPPPAACGFLTFSRKRLRILNQFFTLLLQVLIYARLQIFIQLSQTLTKLCYMRLPSSHNRPLLKMSVIGLNARVQTFAKVVVDFVDRCLLQLASHPRSAAFIMSTNMLDMT